jgi:subtilisin family serine protease
MPCLYFLQSFTYFWCKHIPMSAKKPVALVSVPFAARKFTGRFLVRLDSKTTSAAIIRQAKIKGLNLTTTAGDNADGLLNKTLQQFDGVIFERLRIALVNEAGAERLQQLQQLSNTAFLVSEPERFVRALATSSGSKGKGSLYKDTTAAAWGIHAVGATGVRVTGKGVKLAILDTGFDFTHPDFSGRTIHRRSFVGTRQAKDKEGHGTHIAGIAGGDRKGRDGARYGVASGARLYIGKILDDAGEGTDGQTLAGIEWALEKGCQIISMSFGAPMEAGDPYSEVFEHVAQIAMAHRCLLVAASGNESNRMKNKPLVAAVNHPANCPSVMAVGALTPALGVAEYSCAGAGGAFGGSGGQVDIAAPGDNILSTKPGGGYRRESGTSMATAFVAGVAALLWEEFPAAGAGDIWARLTQQAWRLNLPATDVGAGLCAVRN